MANNVLWFALGLEGKEEEALRAATMYLTALYGDRQPGQALERGRAEGGYAGAMNRAAELLAGGFPEANASPCDIAALYVEGGNRERALDWLEKACEIRDPNVPYIGLPTYSDRLGAEPRFQALLRRMGLPRS